MKGKYWLSLTLILSLSSSFCQAGEGQIRLGGFWSHTDSSIKTKGLNNRDFTLDFEDTLKLEENQYLPFFEIGYKFKDRHYVYADWRSLHREASIISNYSYTLPNNPDKGITAGARVNSRLNIDILRTGYAYSFYQTANTELGASIGLHIMFIETGFSGEISACFEDNGNISCEGLALDGELVSESTTAPLPDIGIWLKHNFNQHWGISAASQLFYLSIEGNDGYLADVNAFVNYSINNNWNVELGYNYYLVEANWKQTTLKYHYRGPMLNLAYTF
ncbi:hypothetical protein [Agarivorans sp.]|uniref:hypothetical protein n=1 Tax=Agarivorans sp. TaxID=1872412 RepID=UPI003D0243E5